MREGSRQEGERFDVAGTHNPEVPVVQRGDLDHAEPFREGDRRSVDEAEVKIGVTLNKLRSELVVVGVKLRDAEIFSGEAGQKRSFSFWSDMTVEQPTRLDDHWGRDD